MLQQHSPAHVLAGTFNDPAAGACGNQPNPTNAPLRWWTWAIFSCAAILLALLACVAAWLSFRSQADYVAAHNGGLRTQADAWALLLDAATAGVSLLRLHDALVRRGAALPTRIVLAGCIGASVTMNVLHTPAHTFGGLVVAAVPPVLYAVLLELLLLKIRRLLAPTRGAQTRRVLRDVEVWLHFFGPMWHARRSTLRQEVAARRPNQQTTTGSPARPHSSGSQTDSQSENRMTAARTSDSEPTAPRDDALLSGEQLGISWDVGLPPPKETRRLRNRRPGQSTIGASRTQKNGHETLPGMALATDRPRARSQTR